MKSKLLAFALLTIGNLSCASAETVTHLGKTITLVLPPGQCLVGDSPHEITLKTSAQQQAADSNRLLAAFADCDGLARIRAGEGVALSSFGQLMASTPGGKPRTMNGMSRATYLGVIRISNQLAEDAFEKAKQKLSEHGQPLESAQSFGIVKTDSSAAYFLFRVNLPDIQDKPVASTGVTAITAVRDLPLSLNFYRRAGEEATAIEMLATQAATMKKFIEANP